MAVLGIVLTTLSAQQLAAEDDDRKSLAIPKLKRRAAP